jgi:transmembrane sensor
MSEVDLKVAAEAYRNRLQAVSAIPSRRRVRARLDERMRRLTRVRRLVFVGAMVAVVCVIAVMVRHRFFAPEAIGGFAVARGAGFVAELGAGEVVTIKTGRGRLSDDDLDLDVAAGTRVRKEAHGVRLLRGSARIVARHRGQNETPLQVLVSGGAIEVVGTRFSVIEREDSGEVALEEGAIRFVSLTGRIVRLAPGERYQWPEEVAPSPAPTPEPEPAPEPEKEPESVLEKAPAPQVTAKRVHPPKTLSVDVDEFLEQVFALRDRGRFEDAIQLLTKAMKRGLGPSTDERLSYEIGSILTDRLADQTRGCQHWSKHLRRFGYGRYASEITAAEKQLHCARNF